MNGMNQGPLRILSELVSINTVNDPINSIKPSRDCAAYIRERLQDQGTTCEILDDEGVCSVLARLGKGRPKLLFLAHYDTVPANTTEWKRPPFQLTLENGKGYGRGALDDKANVAAIITAISELKEAQAAGSLVCAFTGDEEIGGDHGAKFIKKILVQNDMLPQSVVNGDGVGSALIVRRRNSFDVSLESRMTKNTSIDTKTKRFITRADSHHAAYFTPGLDSHCLLEASKFLRTHRDYLVHDVMGGFIKRNIIPSDCELTYSIEKEKNQANEDPLTNLMRALLPLSRVNISSEFSEFGVTISPNVVRYDVDRVIVEVDVRAMTNDQGIVESAFRRALVNLLPEVKVSIEGSGSCVNTDTKSDVVNAGLQTLQKLGLEPRCVEREGASDARHFAPLGIPTIDFGPNGANLHGPDEYVEIDSLKQLPRFYSGTARQLLKQ